MSSDAKGGEGDNRVLSRSIYLTKCSSLSWLEHQGPPGRTFNINESSMRNILLPAHMNKRDDAAAASNNILRRIHLQKMFIEAGTRNQFPFPLGIRIQNLPANEYSQTGDAFSYIIPANTTVQTPCLIFEAYGDEKLQQTWEAEYHKWNQDNLDTLMAMPVPESDVILVHTEHPVLQILEKRQDLFGAGAAVFHTSTTPNWRHVQQSAFKQGSDWIRKNIFSNAQQTCDMSQLTVTMSKTDGTKFTDLSPACFVNMNFDEIESAAELNTLKQNFANIVMQRPACVDIKIGLKYKFSSKDTV